MPEGIQVFDENGTVVLDTNDSITRILGTAQLSRNVNGSLTADFDQGRPFFMYLSRGASGYTILPDVSISGRTLSWSYSGKNQNNTTDAFILYGLY
ncbi:hypothetical protein [Pseudomonas sp. GM_Psu_2]|uniref:hypothetical protein n=1 Tax=unclassified Pseudomonas TaxID=196821 RepID=UPI00226AF9A6|nr:hypothetical protein [Pseudomonas sp. GM_Psu_2]